MAQAYSGKPPVITDDIWYVWDAETDAYLSTGKPSRGEQGLTGPQGAAGPKGDTGEAAGFGVPVATVENSVGVPEVTVSASGPDTAKVFSFAFSGIKGETGAQGPQGAKGEPGAGVGSVVRTAGNGAAGTTDTYTMYNDKGEEIGSFEVHQGDDKRDGEPYPESIIETASGSVISVDDSAGVKLKGLHLYGRSAQDGVPTPENPIEIESAGNEGSITVNITGENICPVSNGKWAILLNTHVTAGVTYTLCAKATDPNSNLGFNLQIRGTNNNQGALLQQIGGQNISNGHVTFTPQVSGWMYINCFTAEQTWSDIAVYVGTVNEYKYIPYSGQAFTYSIQSGLMGIMRYGPMAGVTAVNYTDSDGNNWITDEVDFTIGKFVKHIQSVTLDGTQYVQKETDGFGISTGLSQTYYNAAISEYFNFQDTSKVQLLESGWMRIFDPDGKWDSVEDFKAWLSDTKPVIYAVLETPIETDLPEEVMDAYHQLTMYYPNTTIMTDSNPPAGICVEYIADTKTYIDQKYNDLQKQLDILIGAEA